MCLCKLKSRRARILLRSKLCSSLHLRARAHTRAHTLCASAS